MYVVLPVEITDASGRLTSTTIAEPDATVSEVAWSAGTPYSLGDLVVRTTTHKVYENVLAGTDAGLPESTPARWEDAGYTNKWAMFDTLRSTASVETSSPLIVEITPGGRFDSVGLLDVEATTARVEVYSGATLIYDSLDIDMSARRTTTWYEYFFGLFRYVPSVALFDLPPVSGAKVKVTLTNTTGNVAIGDCIVGMKQYIGAVQFDAEDDAVNFSRIERAFDGSATLLQRRSVPTTSQMLFTPKPMVPRLREVRADLNAIPALWSGLDDATHDYFESLLIKGVYKRFLISLKHEEVAIVSLQLEEI